ncbi:MAG: HEAT repeat domain-containing protein [Planctomycetia bacterium]|nr:HEAT repeat domain-containing protein [Planctomycetia bacterium]
MIARRLFTLVFLVLTLFLATTGEVHHATAVEQAKDKEKAKEPEPEKIKELPKLKADPVQELVGKHKDLIPVLIAALRDGDSEVRQTTAYTLTQLGKEAVPALTAALGDKDPELRANAAIVLGQFGKQAQDALPALLHAMQDPDPEVRRRVIYAISRIVEASSREESDAWRGYATAATLVPVRQVSTVADYRPRDPGLMLKLPPEKQPPAPKRLPQPEAP